MVHNILIRENGDYSVGYLALDSKFLFQDIISKIINLMLKLKIFFFLTKGHDPVRVPPKQDLEIIYFLNNTFISWLKINGAKLSIHLIIGRQLLLALPLHLLGSWIQKFKKKMLLSLHLCKDIEYALLKVTKVESIFEI